MAEGIHYTEPSYPGTGQLAFVGARNGLSLDAAGYVVMGEDAGGSGAAELLNDREVPMGGFYLNYYDGQVVISSDREAASGAGLLQIIKNGIGVAQDTDSLVLMNNTPANSSVSQNSPSLYFAGQQWDGSATQLNAWFFQAVPDGLNLYNIIGGASPVLQLSVNSFGQVVGGEFFGSGFVAPDFQFNPGGVFYTLQVGAGNLPAGTMYLFPTTTATDATAIAAANFDDSINREYFVLGFTETANMLTLTVGAQGTGVVRPVAFVPNIKYGEATAPTAIMHVKASPGTAGNGPFKLTAGTLLATPEPGLIEYDGTHFYATTSTGVRQIITIV